MLILPTLLSLRQSSKARVQSEKMIRQMWLYENGEQLLLETQDDILHKIEIIHTDQHFLNEGKGKELIFGFTNGEREFGISNKGAEVIDYDFIDRVVRSICIDTKRLRQYHRQISRQVPANLRPTEYVRIMPAWAPSTAQTNYCYLNSSPFLWRLKNRTVYRHAFMVPEGGD